MKRLIYMMSTVGVLWSGVALQGAEQGGQNGHSCASAIYNGKMEELQRELEKNPRCLYWKDGGKPSRPIDYATKGWFHRSVTSETKQAIRALVFQTVAELGSEPVAEEATSVAEKATSVAEEATSTVAPAEVETEDAADRVKFCEEQVNFAKVEVKFCEEKVKFCEEKVESFEEDAKFWKEQVKRWKEQVKFTKEQVEFWKKQVEYWKVESWKEQVKRWKK